MACLCGCEDNKLYYNRSQFYLFLWTIDFPARCTIPADLDYDPATSFGRPVPPLRLRIAARTRLAVATASSSAASKAPGATSDAIARTAPTPCAGLRSDGAWKTAALALTAPPKVRRAEPSFLASAVRSASSLACLDEQPVHCG